MAKDRTIQAYNKEHLRSLIQSEMKKYGDGCSLNHIDISQVTDMSSLFMNSPFHGDISQWDVSHVKDMSHMFERTDPLSRSLYYAASKHTPKKQNFRSFIRLVNQSLASVPFNGDISQWDVSNVEDMSFMFSGSIFNQDISGWNTSRVRDMSNMFSGSLFEGSIGSWDVSLVTDMSWMFANTRFNSDISQWNTSNVYYMVAMFATSHFNQDISSWDISSVVDLDSMFAESHFDMDLTPWGLTETQLQSVFGDSWPRYQSHRHKCLLTDLAQPPTPIQNRKIL
jgi:surface protein